MQRCFSRLPHSTVEGTLVIASWCCDIAASIRPCHRTIAVQTTSYPAQPQRVSQGPRQQAVAALQGSLITLDEQPAHSVELTLQPTSQPIAELSSGVRGNHYAPNMEIQPAAQDAQREETVLMIRQDSGESTHDQSPNNGIAEETSPERHTALLPRGLVETVDGDRVPDHVAQALCRKSEQQLQRCAPWPQADLAWLAPVLAHCTLDVDVNICVSRLQCTAVALRCCRCSGRSTCGCSGPTSGMHMIQRSPNVSTDCGMPITSSYQSSICCIIGWLMSPQTAAGLQDSAAADQLCARDAVTRRSAIGFAVMMAGFLPWCLAFMIGTYSHSFARGPCAARKMTP